jgi:hypothetical protein
MGREGLDQALVQATAALDDESLRLAGMQQGDPRGVAARGSGHRLLLPGGAKAEGEGVLGYLDAHGHHHGCAS